MTKRYKVGISKIHGKGLFATVNFQKGARVFIFPGKVVHRKMRTEKESNRFINWIGLGKDLWLNPNQTSARHVNHSCDPNTVLFRRTLYAIKPIEKCDEITFDYSFSDVDPYWHVDCHCGAKNCRKKVGSIYTLTPSLFKARRRYIQPFFSAMYLARKSKVAK